MTPTNHNPNTTEITAFIEGLNTKDPISVTDQAWRQYKQHWPRGLTRALGIHCGCSPQAISNNKRRYR